MKCNQLLERLKHSKHSLLLVVFVAIFLDNMLLTVIVPIMPTLLEQIEAPTPVEALQTAKAENASAAAAAQQCYVDRSRDFLSHYVYQHDILGRLMMICRQLVDQTRKTLAFQTQWSNENTKLGVLFASKATVQLLVNPFVGIVTDKVGYSVPLFSGFVILFVSTTVFAFAEDYVLLFSARALQGIGSSCSSVAGMGLIASLYSDDEERGWAMGIALGGLALGVLVGPPFGGLMYEFCGKASPFLVLAVLAMLDGLLQLVVLRPKVDPPTTGNNQQSNQRSFASLWRLLRDPYILIAAGAITLGNIGIALLEPSLPLWVMQTMNAPKWVQGAVFLPASISYLIGTNVFGAISFKIGRWLSAMLGIIIIAVSMITIPLCKNPWQLIFPNGALGFAIGMVDSSMMPTMGLLVDLYHKSGYGRVYSIADVAFCLSYVIGPLVGSALMQWLGFQTGIWIVAGITVLYAPLLLILRRALRPQATEKQRLLPKPLERTVKKTAGSKDLQFRYRKCSVKHHREQHSFEEPHSLESVEDANQPQANTATAETTTAKEVGAAPSEVARSLGDQTGAFKKQRKFMPQLSQSDDD